jgi:hypothetical protein
VDDVESLNARVWREHLSQKKTISAKNFRAAKNVQHLQRTNFVPFLFLNTFLFLAFIFPQTNTITISMNS